MDITAVSIILAGKNVDHQNYTEGHNQIILSLEGQKRYLLQPSELWTFKNYSFIFKFKSAYTVKPLEIIIGELYFVFLLFNVLWYVCNTYFGWNKALLSKGLIIMKIGIKLFM